VRSVSGPDDRFITGRGWAVDWAAAKVTPHARVLPSWGSGANEGRLDALIPV